MCSWIFCKSIQRDLPAIYRTSTGSPMMNTQMKSTRTTNTVLPPPANIFLLALSSFLSWLWNTYYESNKVQTIKCKQVNVNTSNKRTLQAVLEVRLLVKFGRPLVDQSTGFGSGLNFTRSGLTPTVSIQKRRHLKLVRIFILYNFTSLHSFGVQSPGSNFDPDLTMPKITLWLYVINV